MKSKLETLSLTDFYSFDNPTYSPNTLVKMILQKGGEFAYDNTTNFILGLGLIVIAVVVLMYENNYIETTANILYTKCSNTNCLIGVEFYVGNVLYKKELTSDNNYVKSLTNTETISYLVTNPDKCYLGYRDYNFYSYVIGGIGTFLFLTWMYF